MNRNLTKAEKDQIQMHDYHIEGTLTHPFESIRIGNGDIGASVNVYSHEVKITLAKSDVWDARFDGKPEETVLTHDDLIKMMKEKDRDLVNGEDFIVHSENYKFTRKVENHGPYPKRVGAVRVYHPGLSNTKVSTRVDILTGMIETRFGFPKGELKVQMFVQKNRNTVWLSVEGTRDIPWVAFILEKEPDDADRSLPYPEIQAADDCRGVITQKIPGGFGVDEFEWSLAGKFPAAREGIGTNYLEVHAYRYRYYCAVSEGNRAVMSVGVATSRDGGANTAERAVELAQCDTMQEFEQARAEHIAEWEQYWAKSGVTLPDKELESVWYRNHFSYGCAIKEGVQAPGLSGIFSISDSVNFRGDYHMNHNFQKWYVTAFPTNHPEWVEVYADFIRDKMDTFEYQADLIFGLEGVYCDLLYFPYSPKEYCSIDNKWGRSLSITGWLAQPLWWHYEYMMDVRWLKERAYPYIKKAAQFYFNYIEKYMDADGVIYPSIRIEEPGWFKDFKGVRNVISDLVMFKKCFEWAIAASELLNVDEDWRAKWAIGLAKVPPIRYGWENGEGYIELDMDLFVQPEGERADAARTSRWAGGGWIVFPGEYLDGDEENELNQVMRDMMRRTDLLDPYMRRNGVSRYPGTPVIHPISSVVPTIRLGVMEQFDKVREVILAHRMTYGQASSYMLTGENMPKQLRTRAGYAWYDFRTIENHYLGVIGITEMLLQSQGNVIRLFPYYPQQADVSFRGLRARGGFVLDAWRTGEDIGARIVSESGEPFRIRWSSESSLPRVNCDGHPVEVKRERNQIVFETRKGGIYLLN